MAASRWTPPPDLRFSLKRWAATALLLAWAGRALPTEPPLTHGGVYRGHDPVAGACVRWQATEFKTTTNAEGRFRLPGDGSRLTVWKEGFFIAGAAPARVNVLQLRPLPTADHADYAWMDPRPDPKRSGQCANCHAEIWREHAASAHGHSASDRRFLDLYAGAAEPREAKHDWNLLKENPLGASVCAACHAPTVEPHLPGFDDLRQAQGVPALGVHCDYCHKIADASVERLGQEHGRYAHRLLRPKSGQLFFGPLDDVDRGEETYSPLYKESRHCASCHEGTVLGAKVYGTYSEWLASPAKQLGKQCQDCHMAPTGLMTNIAPGRGGVERDPKTLASHRFPCGELKQLQSALKVRPRLLVGPRGLELSCEVLAGEVGHRVPTGFIDRHLLLVVEAADQAGVRLELKEGPRLPRAAGEGKTEEGAFGGQAGLFFGRLIADEAGESPVPFWRFAKELGDTRLKPGEPVAARWLAPSEAAAVRVRLIHRRFFWAVSQAKGWPLGDVVVFDQSLKAAP